ncbi:hypothetical protein KPH14_006569 [Odynerus spinipes]|uniref:Zinc finger CCCH-type with G patch domain-containing protein n=1 Tax=Odynerus spinipes TaxID=1348599 RepID=A0AAD9VS52_9HYME|nr:hypothetical protein KPH14_006569 [Odynerus spinipes]
MTDVRSLKEAIVQYQFQLSQVVTALSMATEQADKDDLSNLRSNIQELIDLTKENLEKLEGITTENTNVIEISDSEEEDKDDPLATEYALFKTEIEDCSNDTKDNEQSKDAPGTWNDIEDELKQLEGMKCRAHHSSSWDSTGYHNAMICSVHKSAKPVFKSMHEIQVRVLFINPTHKEMLPCPYYLNGNCKFSDDQCHFSHGEVVPLSNLQEYKEPNFGKIKTGSRVLVKQDNKLWHRSVVIKLPDEAEELYRVKLEAKGDIAEVGLQDLVPLDSTDSEMSDTSDDDIEIEEIDDTKPELTDTSLQTPQNCIKQELIDKSLLTPQGNQPLGNWEKHTRGIGSKLMEQMGYVRGTGLGKRADGIVQPVEAVVLPAGRSLDHCMELRQMAGTDKNLFNVERKMRRKQKKLEKKRQRAYEKEKKKEQNNVFNFLNTTLNATSDKNKNKNVASTSKSKRNLKKESNWSLNVANFQVGENITRLEKESLKLKNSMTRHSKDSTPYKSILAQYNQKQKELNDLRACEKNITAEQTQRKNKAKLSIF